jgi:hypothetical protein
VQHCLVGSEMCIRDSLKDFCSLGNPFTQRNHLLNTHANPKKFITQQALLLLPWLLRSNSSSQEQQCDTRSLMLC